jgi:hypothetical protein
VHRMEREVRVQETGLVSYLVCGKMGPNTYDASCIGGLRLDDSGRVVDAPIQVVQGGWI